MLEKEIEAVIQQNPDLIEEGLKFKGRQVYVQGKFVDLVFEDRRGQTLIVELKRGTVKRKHLAQLLDYEGHFLDRDGPTVRAMLVGNQIPTNFKRALNHHGIEWRELPVSQLRKYTGDDETSIQDETEDLVDESPPFSVEESTHSTVGRDEGRPSLLLRLEQRREMEGRTARYEEYLQGDIVQFSEALSTRILDLAPNVTERLNQNYILYFLNGSKLAGFEPQRSKVLVAPLAIPFEKIQDPRGYCRDVSDKTLSMGGEVRADFREGALDIDYAMNLIRQSLAELKER